MNTIASTSPTSTHNIAKVLPGSINIDFMPTRESLAKDLLGIKEIIYQSKKCNNVQIKLITNSGLILLLIPLLLSVRDRLSIEFRFEENTSESLFASNYENCKNFKEILEASVVLQKMLIDVNFSKGLSKK